MENTRYLYSYILVCSVNMVDKKGKINTVKVLYLRRYIKYADAWFTTLKFYGFFYHMCGLFFSVLSLLCNYCKFPQAWILTTFTAHHYINYRNLILPLLLLPFCHFMPVWSLDQVIEVNVEESWMVVAVFRLYQTSLEEEFWIKRKENDQILKHSYLILFLEPF